MALKKPPCRGDCLIERAKHHRKGDVECTMEAPDRIGEDLRLIGDRGGDPWMSKLQEQRTACAQKQRGFPIDPPGYGCRSEQPFTRAGGTAADTVEAGFKLIRGDEH